MVVYVDHSKSNSPVLPSQNLTMPISPLSVDVVALPLASIGAKMPIHLSADDANESGTDSGNTHDGSSFEAPGQNPVVSKFSAALCCYPVVKQIARCVDLNTLDALSRTCREFREILLASRQQLKRETLRCRFEALDLGANPASEGVWDIDHPMFSAGKNCAMKPPTASVLKARLRRLCNTCLGAPLSEHLTYRILPDLDSHFVLPAFRPRPKPACSCNEKAWFCKPCGQVIRSDDTAYMRVFSWRTRYSTYLGGGLGTGIGDTCRGVQCGRESTCLAANAMEVEIDCQVNNWNGEHSDSSSSGDDDGPGYLRQEIMGVGGVVKNKIKKRVRVGASVEEHDDEREASEYLKRERTGEARSWCGWCYRVVPSQLEHT
ncbi:hypothetical protein LOZ65_002802 [Ophidiomyces ophidiicola]|nr:hypothetical protein LOZ65_002802 [Ophidiomyces ophidiicola]